MSKSTHGRSFPLETNKNDIPRCPICGGISFVHHYSNLAMTEFKYSVYCHKCRFSTVKYQSEETAINSWENREGIFYMPGFGDRLYLSYNGEVKKWFVEDYNE